MIDRTSYIEKITQNLKTFKVCALLGPRQCGKTTIATHYANLCKEKGEKVHFFDLEDPDHLNALENPKLVFQRLSGLIIIDEIQRIPELFTVIRVMVDHYDKKFLILGSASQELIRQSSETLAGRIIYNEVHPFRFNETHGMNQLWFRGGFPLSYLSESEQSAQEWLKAYVKTFLEKDIPSFGFDINPSLIRRFWTMLCGYHGNIFNASELGQSLDLNHKTTRRYLDILTGTFMMRTLQPWHANIQKRQVKQPKVYFRDSGIFHVLMGVKTSEDLLLNAKLGASWEGFAMEEIISELKAEPEDWTQAQLTGRPLQCHRQNDDHTCNCETCAKLRDIALGTRCLNLSRNQWIEAHITASWTVRQGSQEVGLGMLRPSEVLQTVLLRLVLYLFPETDVARD